MHQVPEFKIDLHTESLHLPPAPIVEAIIHWQASPSTVGDPKDRRHALQQRFPEYAISPQHQFDGALNGSQDNSETGRRTELGGFRLTSNDAKYICQFKPNEILFSRLAPFGTWNSVVAEASRFWAAFVELAAPERIERMAVRFIFQWLLKDGQEASDLLDEASAPLQSIGLLPNGFFRQDTLLVPNYPYGVHLRRAVRESDPPLVPDRSLIVDIDVFTTQEFDVDITATNLRLNEMRYLQDKVCFGFVKGAAKMVGGRK